MSLVEIDGAGAVTVEVIPFQPFRRVRVLRGKHAELLLSEPSIDFVKAILTDASPLIDPMKRLREVFPNACQLVYERDERAPEIKSFDGGTAAIADPLDLVGAFLTLTRDEGLKDTERELVAATLELVRVRSSAA